MSPMSSTTPKGVVDSGDRGMGEWVVSGISVSLYMEHRQTAFNKSSVCNVIQTYKKDSVDRRGQFSHIYVLKPNPYPA